MLLASGLAASCALWDSALTDALLSSQNAKLAEQAQEDGKEHWTETGVAVTASGEVHVQAIAKGKSFEHIKAGLFLVASPNEDSSIFAKSVVLIVRHDGNGTLGIIINKPAQLSAEEHLEPSEVIEELFGVTVGSSTRSSSVLLVSGGPVEPQSTMILHSGAPTGTRRTCYGDKGSGARLYDSRGQRLVEAETPSSAAGEQVLPGVRFMASRAFVRCALRDEDGPSLRISLGYSGWGPQQLDGEFRRGDWLLCEATSELVFTATPETLWRRMLYSPAGIRLCSRVGSELG